MPVAPHVVGELSRCHDEPVTTAPVASSTFDTSRVHSLTRPNMVSVGTIVWLASELMFFAGLFAMYFTARARATHGWPPAPTELDVRYALVFTLILVLSSVTCQFGVFAAESGNVYGLRRWFTITFVMGLIFVLGQANEYRNLVMNHETTISSSTFGSVFYLTTGFHALHVIGGLVAFIFVLIRSTMGRFTPAQATAAIVVSYYWHFVDVVWVGLFATIYLIQ
jgi:cytochrome c oxidase subunit 3